MTHGSKGHVSSSLGNYVLLLKGWIFIIGCNKRPDPVPKRSNPNAGHHLIKCGHSTPKSQILSSFIQLETKNLYLDMP